MLFRVTEQSMLAMRKRPEISINVKGKRSGQRGLLAEFQGLVRGGKRDGWKLGDLDIIHNVVSFRCVGKCLFN